jgi:hypothetical protein
LAINKDKDNKNHDNDKDQTVASCRLFLQKVKNLLDDEFERYQVRKQLILKHQEYLKNNPWDNDLPQPQTIPVQSGISVISVSKKEEDEEDDDEAERVRVHAKKNWITKGELARHYRVLMERKKTNKPPKPPMTTTREEQRRIRKESLKKLDYLTRALRQEEVPFINQLVQSRAITDQEYSERRPKELEITFRERHAFQLVEKARLAKMQSFREGYETSLAIKQRQDFEIARIHARQRMIIDQREQRITNARAMIQQQNRQREWEEERQRQQVLDRQKFERQRNLQRQAEEIRSQLKSEIFSSVVFQVPRREELYERVSELSQLYNNELIPRNEFYDLLHKECPGCIGMNLICAAEMLNDTEFVWNVIKEILHDPMGEILTCEELHAWRGMSRSQYCRSSDPYPYAGNCIDFGLTSTIVKKASVLGSLISSPTFSHTMKTDRMKYYAYLEIRRSTASLEEFCRKVHEE